METMIAFFLAFVFSFVGSIPPGTLNLSIIQLGIDKRIDVAWRFATASSLVEIPYAWIAVKFESLITSSDVITQNFQLLTGIVMLLLGGLNLYMSGRPSKIYDRFNESGFRRGIILGVLNPMALPFWLAMTAYLKSTGWVDLSSANEVFSYVIGVAAGALVLLMFLAYSARKVVSHFEGNTLLRKIPGITLVVLGLYALLMYVM